MLIKVLAASAVQVALTAAWVFMWRSQYGIVFTAGLVLLSLICWVPLLWKLSKGIARLEQVTQKLSEGHLETRVPEGASGDLENLGRNINGAAQRFDEILKGQKRFLGDVAHELIAPIARVQFALGVLEAEVGSEQQEAVKALDEEVQEMSALVKELSSYSKVGFDAGRTMLVEVNLLQAARRASDRENIPVALQVDGHVTAMAHEVYLTRALSNLLRNAKRYGGQAGPIEVRAERQGELVELVVADHGPGLPESELERIFQPFYRMDKSRSSSTGGKGLGLAIARSCVEACRGVVFCRNRRPTGLEVVIQLAPGPKPEAA